MRSPLHRSRSWGQNPTMTESQSILDEKRRSLQSALAEVQDGVRRTAGLRVARKSWLLPLLAAGVGLTLALALKRRKRVRGETAPNVDR